MGIRADGLTWYSFTLRSNGAVKVVVNPGSSPRNLEISASVGGASCPGERDDSRTRSDGLSVYLMGCGSGSGTVELRQASSNALILTYNFTIQPVNTPPPPPTDTPIPTPTPTGPSFGTAAIDAQRYQAGEKIADLILPAATGGSGALTYSVEPAMGNGLTFNPLTRTVSGTPTAVTQTVLYRYKATDGAGNTAQLRFSVTVFNVRVMADGMNLEDVQWGVLAYKDVTVRVSLTRADGYQFRVGIPASAGFQLYSEKCAWPVEPPTSTATLWSRWMSQNESFDVVRCGLGSGKAPGVEVRIKLEENGTSSLLYAREVAIPQAWHRNDHQVDYKITNPLWPSGTTMTQSRAEYGINLAVSAWNKAQTPTYVEFLLAVSSSDTIIDGYQNPTNGGAKHECAAFACTEGAGTYPHIGNDQPFWIEDEPQSQYDASPKKWTNIEYLARTSPQQYYYLPQAIMHELGHTAGLGHSPNGSGVMALLQIGNPIDAPSQYDLDGIKGIYEHHVKHD